MIVVAAASLLTLTHCARGTQTQATVQRLAILPFENLTGDASLDWVAPAMAEMVASELTGVPGILPLRAITTSEAYFARAGRFIRGYVVRGSDGALQFNMTVEDATRHKIVDRGQANGDLLSASGALSRRLHPDARQFSGSSPDAIVAWGRGDYERAASIDPDFGQAWLAWSQMLLAGGNKEQAIEVASRGLGRSSLRSPIEHARLSLLLANLRGDQAGRSAALTDLSHLVPTDVDTLRTLADAQVNSRQFASAATLYRSVLQMDPGNAQAMNLLGYTEAYAGNLDAAKKAFEEYRRQPDQETNAIDSLGEACFMNGQFQEAEKYFLEGHSRNTGLFGGGELLKASYSRWLAGDRAAADGIFAQYLKFRTGLRDPLVPWREANWLYATGRPEQAIAKLENAPAALGQLAQQQLAAWRGAISVPTDLTTLESLYLRTPPAADGPTRIFYAAALIANRNQEKARALLERWPLPDAGSDPLLQSLVFPRFLEMRKSLGMQKRVPQK